LKSPTATLIDIVGAVAERAPRPVALATGRRLGDLMSHLVRSRRRQVLANLDLAFGDTLSDPKRHELMRQVFRTFGQTLVESLLLPSMVRQGLEQFIRVEGWENLTDAMKMGRGSIGFTGHFGNWELMGLIQGLRGIPTDVVGRPPRDPHLARRLESLRTLTGTRTISKYNAFRPMMRSLREGRSVGLVIDQNVGGGRGVFVDFFGRPASTTPALALLALKTGAPVLPVFSYPEGDGHHRIVYGSVLEVERTGNTRKDIESLTTRATAVIEERIRERPDLWLWMHNRWRSRPPGELPAPVEAQ
jgi:KDO2-lipid IV(A) lauroyltransferase